MTKEFSPKLQECFDSYPPFITEGEIWRVFDGLYPPYGNMFAEYVIKITWWEEWAIDVCNQRLTSGNRIEKIIWLEQKWTKLSRNAILEASNNDYSMPA